MGCCTIKIGNYEFEKKLGSGTYGKVLAVRDCDNGEKLAIKRMRLTNREAAEREIAQLQQLNSKYVVKIKKYFDDDKYINIVMQRCDDSLERKYDKISAQDKEAYQEQIVKGVKYLHSEGVLHRDLKLENILIKKGKIKITDFGLSRHLSGEIQNTNKPYGTHSYQSPEYHLTRNSSQESDCWALGIILMELQLKKRVYNFKEGYQVPSRCEGFPSQADLYQIKQQRMRKVIAGLLKKDPMRRLTASQAKDILDGRGQSKNSGIVVSDTYRNLIECLSKIDRNVTCLKITHLGNESTQLFAGSVISDFASSISKLKDLVRIQYQFNHSLTDYQCFGPLVSAINSLSKLKILRLKVRRNGNNRIEQSNWMQRVNNTIEKSTQLINAD